jgi:SSS family solute:Na+ symporter
VLLLRWFWWRINAWSEISAMISAFVVSTSLQTIGGLDSDKPEQFAWLMLITVAVTTVVWLGVTFLTAPEKQEVLLAFYRRTRPGKTGWQPIARLAPEAYGASNHLWNLLDWFCGCVLVLGILFGTGKFLLGEPALGLALTAVGLAAGGVIYWDLTRRGWKSVID